MKLIARELAICKLLGSQVGILSLTDCQVVFKYIFMEKM